MRRYKKYIVKKRFKNVGICGDLNLPFGTKCFAENGYILCDKGIICSTTSQNAYNYFSQNDDSNGIKRGQLIENILKSLERNPIIWQKVWSDDICLKYKRSDINDHWLWNYDFYNAALTDLRYIAKLVK